MLDFLSRPVKYEAMFKKYSSRKFMKGAIFVKDWISERKIQGLAIHPKEGHAINVYEQMKDDVDGDCDGSDVERAEDDGDTDDEWAINVIVKYKTIKIR